MTAFGLLREISDDELLLMLDWRNATEVRKNMYTQHVISESEHRNWWQKMQSDKTVRYLMFELSDAPCGIVGFTQINQSSQCAMWAFYASPNPARGAGIKMELCALDYAFNELELETLRCEVLAYNKPVIKLHQKFGFGIDRISENAFYVNNSSTDIVHLSTRKGQWMSIRQGMVDKLAAIKQ